MTDTVRNTNRLLRPLLEAAEDHAAEAQAVDAHAEDAHAAETQAVRGSSDAEPLVDEETLARFAEGDLDPEELAVLLPQLDRDPAGRRAAALLLAAESEPAAGDGGRQGAAAVQPASTLWKPWRRPSLGFVLTSAASLLLLATCLVFALSRTGTPAMAEARRYAEAQRLLADRRYEAARRTLRSARKEGLRSQRLNNLEVRALLEVNEPLLLASAAGLPDYGYEIGGLVARAATPEPRRAKLSEALEVLEVLDSRSPDFPTLLNRGFLLLQLDRAREANAEFERAARLRPGDPHVSMGRGLAAFMREQYDEAERQFRAVRQAEPGNLAAIINLAMSLEQQGEYEQALGVWEQLPLPRLAPEQRARVEAVIRELRAAIP